MEEIEKRKERATLALKVFEALHKEFMASNHIPTMDFIEEVQRVVLKLGLASPNK